MGGGVFITGYFGCILRLWVGSTAYPFFG